MSLVKEKICIEGNFSLKNWARREHICLYWVKINTLFSIERDSFDEDIDEDSNPNETIISSNDFNFPLPFNRVTGGLIDLGIAFDGDGDRIGLVDSEGFYFFGDQTLDIIMRDFLKKSTTI